ncbi:hypothetical protein [Nocardia rhamnosiphila]|uniref:Uncharacterized protein n=1 Tax=Nocardia rhamnosiphila TaxID=426716 RepID=A0ABV2WRI2_9NOCA
MSDVLHPVAGWANWSCRWNSTIDGHVTLRYGRDAPKTAASGQPLTPAGLPGFRREGVKARDDCTVQIKYRHFRGPSDIDQAEVVMVSFTGSQPPQQRCATATHRRDESDTMTSPDRSATAHARLGTRTRPRGEDCGDAEKEQGRWGECVRIVRRGTRPDRGGDRHGSGHDLGALHHRRVHGIPREISIIRFGRNIEQVHVGIGQTAIAPARAAGTILVTVTTPGGTSNEVSYTYLRGLVRLGRRGANACRRPTRVTVKSRSSSWTTTARVLHNPQQRRRDRRIDRADEPDIHHPPTRSHRACDHLRIRGILVRSAEVIYIIGSDGSNEPHP